MCHGMSIVPFPQALHHAMAAKRSACSVGLDPNPDLMPAWFVAAHRDDPERLLTEFGRIVLDAVADLVPIVKPQSAYYERFGSRGIAALEATVADARGRGLLVLLDAKRGDIGATSQAYAAAYLQPDSPIPADALTINPYLGDDSLEPFVDAANESGRGLFILALTSNPGGGRLQRIDAGGRPFYEHVAEIIAAFAGSGEGYSAIGAVVGATHPEDGAKIRKLLRRSILLVPGIGAQGGDPEAIRALFDQDGNGAIVNSSRAITFPRAGGDSESEWRGAIRDAAATFVAQIEAVRR